MAEPPTTPPFTTPQGSPSPPGTNKPNWPIVIGVISVSLGGLGMIVNLISALLGGMRGNTQGAGISFPDWFGTYTRVEGVAGTGIALLLLLGGIALLRRRRPARPLHMVYAVANIISSLIEVYIVVSAMGYFIEPGGQMATVMKTSMYIGAFVGGAAGCAYPIFLLIWLSRGRIRAEMQQWP